MAKKKGKGKSHDQGGSGDGQQQPPASTSQPPPAQKSQQPQQQPKPGPSGDGGQKAAGGDGPKQKQQQGPQRGPQGQQQGPGGDGPSQKRQQKPQGQKQQQPPQLQHPPGFQMPPSPVHLPQQQHWGHPQQQFGAQQRGPPPYGQAMSPPPQDFPGFGQKQPYRQQGQQKGWPGPPQQLQQIQGPPQQQQWRGPPQQYQGSPQQQQWQGQPQQQWQGPPQQRQQQGPPQQRQQQGPWQVSPQQQQQPLQGPPQQQLQHGPPPQQQQQHGPPLQQQQQHGPPPQQQQQHGPPPQQQHQHGPPPQQQQQHGPPPQQQQRAHGTLTPQKQPKQGPPPQQQEPREEQQRPSSSQQPVQRKSGPPPQQKQGPPQAQRATGSKGKEQTPVSLGGKGDCLARQALVKPGTKGRIIKIESNHLELTVGKITEAYHYDVAINPDTPKSMLRDVMILFRTRNYPNRNPAFDGRKNLYSSTKLPFGPSDSKSDTIQVEGDNRPREFNVEVKLARTVDLTPLHDMLKTRNSPQDALQCLDIVLRNAPANSCISAGRCFFTPPQGEIIPLGEGMEMYYGFYQSAIRGWKPLLNVDVAHKAFPTASNVLDLICDLGSDFRSTMQRRDLGRPINDFLQKSLEKFVRMLKVRYEIPGQAGSRRIYRVNGLGETPAKAMFKQDDGRQISVAKYFQDVKRVRLQYEHLPTLWVGSRDRTPRILLPLEFCTIVEGQAVNRKMTENQTSAMIKKSATSTDVRKQKIMHTLTKANFNNDPCIREFGFSINNQFERLDARVLQPPKLLYAGDQEVQPSRGVWRADRNKFLKGAQINKWTIACATRNPCRVEQLADMITKFAGSNGIKMSQAIPPFAHIGPRQNLQEITEYFKAKKDFDLIFVVVPNSGPQYSYVKQAAELNVGCLTQCIKERTVFKLNPQTVGNILLKVNSKMNGTNHAFGPRSRPAIMSRPCMIMGADVTHPSPDAKDIPSVAAVTASHDPKAFQYNTCWRLQPPKVEIIEDLCDITVEQLKFFYTKTNCKPERIIFFRDGVSEGQFEQVQRAEITAIREACKKLQADNYEPKITFLVVQKRHHTRLFPTNPRDSEDKNNNVPAGTCVDTMITNPNMQDFYLVSHASIQGVAKPTKYCTLWDDNDMNNDDIEELTYHLCHMFTRCNRSVSYPAPTYYAHLAAARAKVYIENDKLNMDQLKRHQESYQIKHCIQKEKPMFFV